jgi:hypothetical protein
MPAALIEHETLIHRTVLAGEHLFAISPGTVTAHALDDPATALAELQLDAHADFTPLVQYVAPPVESSVEVATALVADPAPSSARHFRPTARDLYAVPQSPSLAAQFRAGRDAAIAQLARPRTFGDYVVPQSSSFADGALSAVDLAFDHSAYSPAEEVGSESDDSLDGVSLTPQLAAQFN